jgi:hypothetical protein
LSILASSRLPLIQPFANTVEVPGLEFIDLSNRMIGDKGEDAPQIMLGLRSFSFAV